MTEVSKQKFQGIPFIIDAVRVVKRVSKYTTCNDVLAKLPNLQIPLAVFLSVNGVEKELPGKAKLLKVWRANGSSVKVEFVIGKSETVKQKVTKDSRKLFGNKKRCDKADETKRLSKESLKQVSDLAFYVRYQKLKLKAFGGKSAKVDKSTATDGTPQTTLMKKITSHASTNSMDAFLAKADLDEMARFLSFCGKVTTEKLGRGKRTKQNSKTADSTLYDVTSDDIEPSFSAERSANKSDIQGSIRVVKLGLKQKFTSKNKLTTRTTSTGTIESTDTGYGSVENDADHQASPADVNVPRMSAKKQLTRRHTLLLEDQDGVPRHSTPVAAPRPQKRTAETYDCTLTQDKLDFLDDSTGKRTILEKYMADQTMARSYETESNDDFPQPEAKRQRTETHSLPVYRNQEDRCRLLWNKYSYCDSDSDSDSDISSTNENLDVAFMDATEEPAPKRLRRESAISNLNRFSISNRYSLPAHAPTLHETKDFDYSFNCSFPRMDGHQSFDFSYSFSESETSDNDLDLVDKTRSYDDSMDSFMNTKLYLGDSLDITACGDNILERNVTLPDEGLGSTTSGSLCSEPELFI